MTKRSNRCAISLTIAVLLSANLAQAQTRGSREQNVDRTTTPGGLKLSDLVAQARRVKRPGFALMPSRSFGNTSTSAFRFTPMAGPNLAVLGSGTVGRLTKWTAVTSSNSFIGDSTIFESKLGLVGIGTDSPSSKLTVVGAIESTIGGFKFPDGTAQTTSASGALFGVEHDATLTGNGMAASPLGIAVPLRLIGSIGEGGVVEVTNTARLGPGIISNGGPGGRGVLALAGDSVEDDGASGVTAFGGSTSNGNAGNGVGAVGGDAFGAGNRAGLGILALGGEGFDGAVNGMAGLFAGDVDIFGDLNVTLTKNFKIDHPLDPQNKYLFHAAIESAEVLNIYSGNAQLDPNGEAVINLPEWFQAINRDFRYSLTPIGAPSSGLFIAQEVVNSRFKIAGGVAGTKVSWQVTGVRSDAGMERHPFKAEQDKPAKERGTYLNPEAFGQPEERGLEWARHPERMQQRKQQRIEDKRRITDQ